MLLTIIQSLQPMNLTLSIDSFYATKEERRKTAKREYENQMAYRKHLQCELTRNP